MSFASVRSLLLTAVVGFLFVLTAGGRPVEAGIITPVEYFASVDDYAELRINNLLVLNYDAFPQGNAYGSVTLGSGWYPIELIYQNRYGSTYLGLYSRNDPAALFELVPAADLRSLDASGATIQGLRADYYTLGGTYLGAVYGEGPISHGWLNLYQGVTGQWAGGLVDTNWGNFEERLTGEIFVASDNSSVPEPSSLIGFAGLGLMMLVRSGWRRRGRSNSRQPQTDAIPVEPSQTLWE